MTKDDLDKLRKYISIKLSHSHPEHLDIHLYDILDFCRLNLMEEESEKIKIINSLEEWEIRGYIVDTRWAFCGYKCIIWEIHNDHDVDIEIKPSTGEYTFTSRLDAYKEALEYLERLKK